MKKKLTVFLLSAFVAFHSFSAVYAADEFTDGSVSPDNVTDPEVTSDTEDTFSAGSDFSSEPAPEDLSSEELFSDEKELSPAREGDITTTSIGQGLTAPTSVYIKGSSFGRVKSLTKLKNMGISSGSYVRNWASPEYSSYYTDSADNLHIVTYKSQKLYDFTCDHNLAITNTVTIDLPLPLWGGFYAAPDGNFYIAVGQNNPNENSSLTVVRILKYDRTWKLLGTTDIKGGYSNTFTGIYIPFDASSLRMVQTGSTLIVHTGREMYSIGGVHHQSDITFVINTQTMTLIDSDMPYNSHSFNQFVVNDGSQIYFLDHGDAYDRGLILSSFSAYAEGYLEQNECVNLFPFMGEEGDNYTGCSVTDFSLIGDTLITIGKSVPHSFAVNGETGDDSSFNQNIFMILTDKNDLTSTFTWLTQHSPSGSSVTLTEPRLISAGNDRYVILYSEEASGQSILHYLLMDNSGTILLSKDYKNVTFRTDSKPVLWGRNITWVSGNYDNGSYDTSNACLYQIPVVTVPLTAVALDQTNITLTEGNTQKLSPVFSPSDSDDVKDTVWTSSNADIASVSSDGTIHAKGYGKATITATVGDLSAQCQVTVKIPETNDPLARPSLKLTQTSAKKMHLTWNKISGAKGYQVYCKTGSQNSYKRIATLRSASLSYDAAVTPGKKYSFKVRAYGTNASGKTKYSKSSPGKTKTAIVPAPAKLSWNMAQNAALLSWAKVDGVSGYVVYRDNKAVKTLKASATSWKDTQAYDSQTGMYWIHDYHIKAFRTVNGKKIYSKATKLSYFYW